MDDFDAVIVGSGAGGGTAAYALARGGLRVLLVEKSDRDPAAMRHQDERRMMLEREASYPEPIVANGAAGKPIVGSLPGGSTSLYGAVMARPAPDDFHPGKHYGERLDRALWDWPFDYAELAPYLTQAEDLYHVAGEAAPPGGALGRRETPYVTTPPPLAPINTRLARGFVRAGLRPRHLPLAIDFGQCRLCPSCPGFYCPTTARASSWKVAIGPAVASGKATVWSGVEALRLETAGRRATRLIARRGAEPVEVTARHFLIAASALRTPAVLERSGLGQTSGQLGRNFMFHLGAIAFPLFAGETAGAERFVKQLGFDDWYFGAPGLPHKLGFVQAVPIPGPHMMQSKAPVPVPLAVCRALQRRGIGFVMTIEDLPRARNRVVARDGGVTLEHRFHDYDRWRARKGLGLLRRALSACGPLGVLEAIGDEEVFHLAHQVGTARCGDDPARAVLDRHCRVHDADNVHVVDGSFMPTSLGVGPALTIAANALRVADHILGAQR